MRETERVVYFIPQSQPLNKSVNTETKMISGKTSADSSESDMIFPAELSAIQNCSGLTSRCKSGKTSQKTCN